MSQDSFNTPYSIYGNHPQGYGSAIRAKSGLWVGFTPGYDSHVGEPRTSREEIRLMFSVRTNWNPALLAALN